MDPLDPLVCLEDLVNLDHPETTESRDCLDRTDLLDQWEGPEHLDFLEWKDCLDPRETRETLVCLDPLDFLDLSDSLDTLDQRESLAFLASLERASPDFPETPEDLDWTEPLDARERWDPPDLVVGTRVCSCLRIYYLQF